MSRLAPPSLLMSSTETAIQAWLREAFIAETAHQPVDSAGV